MIHSFRFRLALLSASLSGMVLLGFGGGSWWLIRNVKLQQMDSELRNAAERAVNRRPDGMHWPDEMVRMAAGLGLRDPTHLQAMVAQGNGPVVYRSPMWPRALDSEALGWPPSGAVSEAPPPSDVAPGPAGPPRGAPPDAGPHFRPDPGFMPPFESAAMPSLRARAPLPPVIAFHAQVINGQTWHIALARTAVSRVAVAMDVQAIATDMQGIRNGFLLALPFALVVVGLASWWFANRALAPVHRLAQATRMVTASGLDQRIAQAGEDREFVTLIELFNRMLARLERSFKQAHRFSADAAHELRTPLAIVQGQLERAIAQAADGSPMQANLTSILDEVRRLSVISRKLLLLSQADAGRLTVVREPVDLSSMLDDLIDDTRMLAPALRIEGEIASGIVLQADGSLLRQVLHNLISNAIKYNLPEGWIRIGCRRQKQSIKVVVANASRGIAPAQREKIFQRFYRADPAHSRHIDGVGLGLSVAREIARAHGGELLLQPDLPGGVEFALVLPL